MWVSRPPYPWEVMAVAMNFGIMWTEAASVIAFRSLGMMGVLPMRNGETRRMVSEKGPAFAASATAAMQALATGRRFDEAADVAISRLRRKTRSNARRLGTGTRRRR